MKAQPMFTVSESAINEVKGLIAKKAIESWRKLPPKTRAYIEINDMIEDGVYWTVKFLAKGHFNPKKGKLTTILWAKLDNYYHRCAELLNAQKRFDGFDSYLEDLKANGFDISIIEESGETREHVRRVFLNVYIDASENLRESMRKWFLQTESTKIHTTSSKFYKDKKEFKILANKYHLDLQDCRAIMYSTQIKNEIIGRLPEYTWIQL
jgi:hypothetical protein